MKSNLILLSLVAFVVTTSGSLHAASDLTASAFIKEHQPDMKYCAKTDFGKITKVDVLSGKEVRKLTKGGMKVDPSKRFAVIYIQRGKIKDYIIHDSPLAADVTSSDLSLKLKGIDACVEEPQD